MNEIKFYFILHDALFKKLSKNYLFRLIFQ